MAANHCIWIVSPPGYVHAEAFREVAIGLQAGFRELGCHAPIVTDRQRVKGRPVVLGANLLAGMQGVKAPGKSILYNLEQITPGSDWLTADYLKLLKRHPVWDYSLYNIGQLARLGIHNVTHCPLGFSEVLQAIKTRPDKDIDVLFYGSLNPRRQAVLAQLAEAGLRVESLFGIYGSQRDAMIARSRIVLNIHYYPSKIFEIARISWLLANAVCVVSEDSPSDSALEAVQDGIVQAHYEQLVETCCRVIADGSWAATGQRGLDVFRQQRQADFLATALGMQRDTRRRA